MESLIRDVRYGFRMLRNNLVFAVVAVFTLALGIGANSAVFSVVNAVLLRPLSYKDPEQLVAVMGYNPKQSLNRAPISPLDFSDYQTQNKVFEGMAAYWDDDFNLAGGDQPESVQGALVTANFFSVLGTRMSLGRPFLPEEDRAGSERTAVLSHGFWLRRFNSDPGIVDKTINLNGGSFLVVGIASPAFRPPNPEQDLWVPVVLDGSDPLRRPTALNLDEMKKRKRRFLNVIARLKPGATASQAQAEMRTIASQLEMLYPDMNTNWSINVIPLQERMVGDVRLTLYVLLGAVGLVLLIACTNVANLQVARAAAKEKEVAIRTALGAGRLRILRQLLTESVVLSVVGGAAGLLLAYWMVKLLVPLGSHNLPRAGEVGLDGRVLVFTLAISALTGILFGLIPAVHTSKLNLSETLKEGGRGATGGLRGRMRGLLVVSEVALASILLIGAGLMIKSVWLLGRQNPGLDTKNVLTMRIALPQSAYPEPFQKASFFREVLQRVESTPGVLSAAATTFLPLSGNNAMFRFNVEGRPPSTASEVLTANYRAVSPNYFRTLGIPLHKGRDFSERDGEKAPGVIIINETMASRYFPGEDPLGKRLVISFGSPDPREVVGVVGDVKHAGLNEESGPEMYVPYLQTPWATMTLAVRTATDPESMVGAIRNEVRAVDKDQSVSRIRMMEQFIAGSMSEQRFTALLLLIFAGAALALAVVGIYGVVAYAVTQREREIAIRMALGAQRSHVLKLIVRQGIGPTLVGVLAGLGAAFALTRVMSSLLYGVSVTDPLIFIGTAIVLSCVALLASFIPARRAVNIEAVNLLKA